MAYNVQRINSDGLMRYGHFSSSKRSVELDEPLYLNLYTISINAADLPNGLIADQQEVNVVLEGVRSISGFETQPGLGSPAVQKYKFAERGYTGGQPGKTHLELTVNFELNLRREDDGTDNNYTYKFLRRWADLCYDPQTGRMSIKKNYACRAWTITMQDKEGVPYHQWTCYNIFPTSGIQAPQLSYDNGNIWQNFPMTFWCDTFDETVL